MEGAWAYRDPANVSRQLQVRLETRPKPLQAIRWTAQVRLCTRHRPRIPRGKNANQGVVAMARARVACLWAIAPQVSGT
jgi:hypothetical protein